MRWPRTRLVALSRKPKYNVAREVMAMMEERDDLLRRITVNPAIFQGKPTIRGMRIKVENVLALLEQGATVQEILEDFPDLEPDDIRACIAYAPRSAKPVLPGGTSGGFRGRRRFKRAFKFKLAG